jgi:hypothetical protein
MCFSLLELPHMLSTTIENEAVEEVEEEQMWYVHIMQASLSCSFFKSGND